MKQKKNETLDWDFKQLTKNKRIYAIEWGGLAVISGKSKINFKA